MKVLKTKSFWFLVGIIHVILSFWYEDLLFTKKAFTDVKIIEYSQSEILFFHIFTKITGGIIILLLWQIIPQVLKFGKTKKSFFIPFFLLTLGYMSIAFITYPDVWSTNIDDYVDFSLAIRYMPDYWQHYFTNVVYGSCFQVFPHPLSLTLIQSGGFASVVSYLYYKLKTTYPENKLRYCMAGVLLLPTGLEIATIPYRNCFYTIICLWTISFLTFEYINKEKLTIIKAVVCLISAVILAGWRSEGILFLIFIPIYMIFIYQKEFVRKKIILFIAGILALYYLFSIPQNIGMNRYFGKDYLIINVTNSTLTYLLNAWNINLDYPEAETDLENIDKVISLKYIKEIPNLAYQKYNEDQGRYLSQTLATEEQQSAYIKSAYNIILHNPILYIRERITCFAVSLGVDWPDYISSPSYQGIDDPLYLAEYTKLSEFGEKELMATYFWKDGQSDEPGRIYNIYTLLKKCLDSVMNPILVTCKMGIIVFLIWNLIFSFLKKRWFWFCLTLNLGLQIGIIFLMEPESRTYYIYPMFYCGIMLLLVTIFEKMKENKLLKEEA